MVESWYFRTIKCLNLWDLETLWYPLKIRLNMPKFPSEVGMWVRVTGKAFRFVSFARACLRAVWLPSGIWSQIMSPAFSLFARVAPSFPFSLVCQQGFSLFRLWSGTTSKWNRCASLKLKRNGVQPKWHQKKPKWDRSEIGMKSKLQSKWIESESEINSKWTRSDIEVESKWHRSESKAKSKWTRSEIEVNRCELEVNRTWNRTEIERDRSGIEVK